MSAAATNPSPTLKALISAPHALGTAIPSPPNISSLFSRISFGATKHGLDQRTWLCLSTASLVTLNSPSAVCDLYSYAVRDARSSQEKAIVAAIMRETGLKCISFSGIPRTINALGALRSHLDEDVKALLSTEETRQPTQGNVNQISSLAHNLWDSIYSPLHTKLLSKLSDSHPDLPVHILNSHYGALLSDPPSSSRRESAVDGSAKSTDKIGRILTSVVAIACLRAQQGVGPQVTSHVFGLKKAADLELVEEEAVQGQEWLTSDEGAQWVLRMVDDVVATMRAGTGGVSSFAALAKL